MKIKLTLALPHDEVSVPVVRRLLTAAMNVLGVDPDVTSDIELALTEAVTNVLEHSTDADEYEVSAGIDGDRCVIEVVNRGAGFDGSLAGLAQATVDDEGGRGIHLMRALVDTVEFTRRAKGTTVHLEKKLQWREGSVLQHLTGQSADTGQGPWSRNGGEGDAMDEVPGPAR